MLSGFRAWWSGDLRLSTGPERLIASKMTRPNPSGVYRIGTRGSPLALAQANETRDRLMRAHDLPPSAFDIVVIKTTGDRITDRSLAEVGGKGLFTKEIEVALSDCDIDLAVHSMKDMPVEQPGGLTVDTYLEREDVRDAFLTLDGRALSDIAQGATVGTSSLRRRAQVLHRRPDLKVVEFRGNVDTRIGKLNDGIAEGTFLAMAGLRRLELLDKVTAVPLPPDEMLPAVAQGAIGIERREDDDKIAGLLEPIRHAETMARLAAERAFLAALDGSCQTPIAGLAVIEGGRLLLKGEILRPDGSVVHAGSREGAVEDGSKTGRDLADELLGRAGPEFF